jgi:hypothetical protein
MPNGRPGDHPLTDILSYGASNYPEDINALVKQLAQMPGFAAVRDRVANILWEDWPAWQNVKPDFAKVRVSLLEVQRELQTRDGSDRPAV